MRLVAREFALTKMPDGVVPNSAVITPDATRVAMIVAQNGRQCVLVDGAPSDPHESILEGTPIFSPDSRHFAYAGSARGKWSVFLDGNEVAGGTSRSWFSRLLGSRGHDAIAHLIFSAGGRLAFVAANPNGQCVVLDGHEQPAFASIGPGSLCFSADGQRFAYSASDTKQQFVILDGEPMKRYDAVFPDSLRFSPDGKRIAYVAVVSSARGGPYVAVVDGREHAPFNAIMPNSLRFSPDGCRVAYTARNGASSFIVIDGTPGPPYDNVSFPIYSPDGRLAHATARGDKYFFIVDGQPRAPFDYVSPLETGFTFSPDGRRDAYVAVRNGAQHIVIDEVPGEAHDACDRTGPVFSPDSQRIGYLVYKVADGIAEESWAVIDGQAGPRYDATRVGSLKFSPDSRHAAYLAGRDKKPEPPGLRREPPGSGAFYLPDVEDHSLVIDGTEMSYLGAGGVAMGYHGYFETPFGFIRPNVFRVAAFRGFQVYRVDIETHPLRNNEQPSVIYLPQTPPVHAPPPPE
jgi:Tol biopolymer transport system component